VVPSVRTVSPTGGCCARTQDPDVSQRYTRVRGQSAAPPGVGRSRAVTCFPSAPGAQPTAWSHQSAANLRRWPDRHNPWRRQPVLGHAGFTLEYAATVDAGADGGARRDHRNPRHASTPPKRRINRLERSGTGQRKDRDVPSHRVCSVRRRATSDGRCTPFCRTDARARRSSWLPGKDRVSPSVNGDRATASTPRGRNSFAKDTRSLSNFDGIRHRRRPSSDGG
jgi:hypothetical protein